MEHTSRTRLPFLGVASEWLIHWAFCPIQVPEELQDKEFAAVLQEEPLQPLALEPLTEEEQVGLG